MSSYFHQNAKQWFGCPRSLELVRLDAAGQNIGIRKYSCVIIMIMTTGVSKTKERKKKGEKKRKEKGRRMILSNR
jgi:hypothetical protein